MTTTLTSSKPATSTPPRTILRAVGYSLIPVAAMVLAGTIVGVAQGMGHPLSDTATVTVQVIAMVISIGVGLLLSRRFGGAHDIGFRSVTEGWLRRVWWLAPILLIEAMAFLDGLDLDASGVPLVLVAVFCAVVGIHEELYYRGLIAAVLHRLGWRVMLIGTSVLFGIGHAATALTGKDPILVAAQIVFAFLFGVVAMEIVVLTGSLWPAIIWHAAHDFFASITPNSGGALLAVSVQITMLLAAAIAWWNPAKRLVNPDA
jgi:membrane protease YdiL (CAAX protease family)